MIHRFKYNWLKSSDYPKNTNNLKVFGTFICGGGSTMGYKLAGFNHLGGVEIDEKMANIYKINHNPKYLYVEDLRKFNIRSDIPDELYELDLLDGSPPCTTFSIAGDREKSWGSVKKYNEGRNNQTLDDLIYVYCETINKLKPKIFLLENVKGLISGNAKIYTKNIIEKLNSYGYKMQLFLLNSATMGVPQRRERIFFIGRKRDLDLSDLKLEFNEPSINFGEIMDHSDNSCTLSNYQLSLWKRRILTDKTFGDIVKRVENRISMFTNPIIHNNEVPPTFTSSVGVRALYNIPRNMNKKEVLLCNTFPLDYIYDNVKIEYITGMSVPPVMIANIAIKIYEQWFNIKEN